MLTVENLKNCGVNTDEGVTRCAGMADFYLGLVKSVLSMDRLNEMEAQINAGDYKAAFESAHAMKGMYANLSLTPVLNPVSEMTERLRAGDAGDYSAQLSEAKQAMGRLITLLD